MIYSTQNTASQLDQAIQYAYSGLVVAGTGLVRTTGTQRISGSKTFADNIVFESSVTHSSTVTHNAAVTNNSTLSVVGNASLTSVSALRPNASGTIDFGTTSLRFKDGYFNNVNSNTGTFATINATNLNVTLLDLTNKTGSNFTISGTTRLNNLVISGNSDITGNLTTTGTGFFTNLIVTGSSRITGSLSVGGSINLTGNLNITGNTILGGNLNTTGNLFVSGASTFTGNIHATGNVNIKGNINSTGTITQRGGVLITSNTSGFTFKSEAASATFDVSAPVNITGSTYIDGNVTIGNSKNLNVYGRTDISGDLNVGGNIRFGTIFATGTSSSAPIVISGRSLINNLQSGAIEYDGFTFYNTVANRTGVGSNLGKFVTGVRYIDNLKTNYAINGPFGFDFITGKHPSGVTRFLGQTGLVLSNPGLYKIESRATFRPKATTPPAPCFGFSGADGLTFNRFYGTFATIANSDTAYDTQTTRFVSGTGPSGTISGANLTMAASVSSTYLSEFYVVITGSGQRIYPFLHSAGAANTTGRMTGLFFSMTTEFISPQTGITSPVAIGPWFVD